MMWEDALQPRGWKTKERPTLGTTKQNGYISWPDVEEM
jgi:hypothetical protein